MTGKRNINVLKILAIVIFSIVGAFTGKNLAQKMLMPQSFEAEEIEYVSNPCLHIWQQGIEGMDYDTLDIKILDYKIDVKEVYTTPLGLLDNSKVQLTMNYWGYNITQEENALLVSDQNSFKKKLRIEFQGTQISGITQTYDTEIYTTGVMFFTVFGTMASFCILLMLDRILNEIIKDN